MESIIKAIKIILLFIITNASNICLVLGVGIILRYIQLAYGFETMLLGSGVFLIFSSIVLELNKTKYAR